MNYPQAEARSQEFRQKWTHQFGRVLVLLGVVYSLVDWIWLGPSRATLAEGAVSVLSLGAALWIFLRPRSNQLGLILVSGLFVCALISLWQLGFQGPSGPLLCVIPLCATLLLDRRGAFFFTFGCGAALVTTALLFSSGRAPADPLFRQESLGAWLVTTIGFFALALSTSTLMGAALRDLAVVSEEFEDAREGLRTAGLLRVAAEEARDRALALRNQSRSVEALGVVAGSVVHDLNNMAQVIRTWADEIGHGRGTEASRDAAESIVSACDRLTHLAGDVRSLGQTDPDSKSFTRVVDALPKTARALRRFVRSSIRIVVDSDLRVDTAPLPLGEADLIHIALEAAASIATVGTGTLIVSAPSSELDRGPEPRAGMQRYPLLLALELRRDGNTKSARSWLRPLDLNTEGKEVLCTSETRVLLWCPARDSVCVAFDLFPSISGPTSAFLPSLPLLDDVEVAR